DPMPSGITVDLLPQSSAVDARDELYDDRGPLLALDLEHAVDVELVAARDLGDGGERRAEPHAASRGDRRGEPHLVEAVVDEGGRVGDDEKLRAQRDEQGEREEPVGDGAAERGVLRPVRVDVDVLVVAGRVGE